MSLSRTTARTASLVTPFEQFSEDAEVRRTMRALFAGIIDTWSLGWPQLVADPCSSWLRPSDVLVELARAPACAAFELAVALHAESGTRLVDRLLGAPTSTGVASASGAPTEAECGLLAYAAARLCVARQSGLIVRDVRRVGAQAPLDSGELVVWPLSVMSSFGALHASLLLTPPVLGCLGLFGNLELSLRDRAEPTAISELALDDLLVSDEWTLTNTTEGLAGEVVLSTPGTSSAFAARLSRGQVRVRHPVEKTRDGAVELVLARRQVPVLELAGVAAGKPLQFAPLPEELVALYRGGELLAEGELIVHRGAIGMRITRLPDAPH